MTITDEKMIADFTGTSPQAIGPINLSYAGLITGVRCTFKAVTNTEIPANGGCFRALEVICPEGTILSAKSPAPVSIYYESLLGAIEVMWKALAPLMPHKLSMHAAGVEEPASNYIWENLAASDFSSGAVQGFTLMTPALEKYAIAGVMHMDHLAALSGSAIHRRSIDRLARETAEALGIDRTEAEQRLHDLLARHRAEWFSFVASLGPSSFVAKLTQVSPWPQ